MARLTSTQTGAAGEAAVAAAFLRNGIPVYLPIGDEGVDLVADFGDRPQRIQVKTCSSAEPIVRFRLVRRRSARTASAGGCWSEYAEGQIDWFALYAMAYDRVVLVRPTHATTLAVRFKRSGKHQWKQSDIIDVEDYDISAVLARICEET